MSVWVFNIHCHIYIVFSNLQKSVGLKMYSFNFSVIYASLLSSVLSFKFRFSSPAISIIICSYLYCIYFFISLLSLTRDIRERYERIDFYSCLILPIQSMHLHQINGAAIVYCCLSHNLFCICFSYMHTP